MKKVAGWILMVLPALLFTLVGGVKLPGVPGATLINIWILHISGLARVTGKPPEGRLQAESPPHNLPGYSADIPLSGLARGAQKEKT